MIINVAGFKVGIYAVTPFKEVPLRNQLKRLQTCLPAQFHLRVHFSKRPLFDHLKQKSRALSIENPSVQSNQPSWKMWYSDGTIRIKGLIYPQNMRSEWEMILNPTLASGVLRHENRLQMEDALCFPLDQILLYFLAVWNQAFILHASAVRIDHHACFFTGPSGIGKSTIARLCSMAGAEIIHDDKIMIHTKGSEMMVYPIPWGDFTLSRPSRLVCGFTLEQNKHIGISLLNSGQAFDLLFGNMIFYPIDPEVIQKQFHAISTLSKKLPVNHLQFPNDPAIVSSIRSIIQDAIIRLEE